MIDWETVRLLSKLRSRFNYFDEEDRPYYHALSVAIEAVKEKGFKDAETNSSQG